MLTMSIGIGIFGCNELTKTLVPMLKEKGFNVVGIWGRTIQEAQEYANALNINFFTNKIDEVLLKKEVLLLFVLTQPYLHSVISVKCLGIGKHVVCVGPIGIGVADAQKMVNASEYYPSLITIINNSLRFLPAFIHLKKAINENFIGDIHLIDINVKVSSMNSENYEWIHDRHMGGGCLTLSGSHVIDLVHFLTGKKATRVHGVVRNFKNQTETIQGIRSITAPDFTTFQMELDGGILVTANIKSNHPCKNGFEQEMTVIGQHGNLSVIGGDLFCYKKKHNDPNGEFKEEKLYVEIQASESLHIKGMNKMLSALKESFNTASGSSWNKQPVSSAANFNDGLYVQTVIDAIKKSSENRIWVKIESPDMRS